MDQMVAMLIADGLYIGSGFLLLILVILFIVWLARRV